MDRFVRVTLEKPYHKDNGEFMDIVGVRYGTEPAVMAGSQVADSVWKSELLSQIDGERLSRVIPGKPIIYEMQWTHEERRTMVVPDYVARHHFGDWDLKPGEGQIGAGERTHPAEKRRIATLWGGYKRETRDRMVPNHWRSLRITGAPNVPHVVIHALDSAYRQIPGFEFRPWDFYAWDKDVTASALAKAPTELVGPNGLPLDLDAKLERMVEERVQALMNKSRKAA